MPVEHKGYLAIFFSLWAYFFVPYNQNIPVTNNLVELSFSFFESLFIRPPWKCPTISISSSCEVEALKRLRFAFGLTKYVPIWGSSIREKTVFIKQSATFRGVPVVLYESTAYSEGKEHIKSGKKESIAALVSLWWICSGKCKRRVDTATL